MSSIDRLPAPIREAIGKLRREGATIDEILAHLATMAVDVSRSAVGRHVKHLDKLGARLRQSRALAEGLGTVLGDAPSDKLARVNIELLHSFLSDTLASAEEEGEQGDETRANLRNPKGAALFAEAVERLTKASRHNQEFVERIEKRAAARAEAAAATRVEAEAKARGLSAETAAAIKASVFGVKAA